MQRSAYHKVSNLVAKSKNRLSVIPKILRSHIRDALAGAEARKQEQKNREVPGGEDPGEYSGFQKSKQPGIPTLLCTPNWQRNLRSSCVGYRSPLQSPLQTEGIHHTKGSQTRISDARASAQNIEFQHTERASPPSYETTRWLYDESTLVYDQEPNLSLRTDAKRATTRWLLDHHTSKEARYSSGENCGVIGPWMEFVGASAKNAKLQHTERASPLTIDTNCETTRWLCDGSTSSSQPCICRKRGYQLATDFEPRTRRRPSVRIKSKGRRYNSPVTDNLPRSYSWHRPLGSRKWNRSTKQLSKEDNEFQPPSWLTSLDFLTLSKVKCILQNNSTEYEENEEDKAIRIFNLLNGGKHDSRKSLIPPPVTPGKGKVDSLYSSTAKRSVLHKASSMVGCQSTLKHEQRDKRKPKVYTIWKSPKQNYRLSQKKRKRCDLCIRRRETCNRNKKPRTDRAERQTFECQRKPDSFTAARRWQRRTRRRKCQLRHKSGTEDPTLRRFLQSSRRKRKKSMSELDDDGSTPPHKWQHLHVAAFLDESDLLEVIQNRKRRSLHWFQRLAKYPRKYYTTILIPSRDIRTWRRWLRANGDPCSGWENTLSCTRASNSSPENIEDSSETY